MNDSEIIGQVLSGNRDAYAELVRRYQARTIRLCASLLKNEKDAEDAAQEAFIRAYQSLDSFRQTSSFYTWLYRIATNHCLSLLRNKSAKSTESLDALLENEGDGVERLLSSADFRRSLEARELTTKLLGALRPNYRAILVLREAEGLSYEEIGQVLSCSVDSVKAQLRRARMEIDEKLRHFFPDQASKKTERKSHGA